ncbi:Ig-like domain-containing protein [Massilia sp. PAMC28688]|uniref:Ig-like domain-containing protein n=1 Tax=Massilia sp. PAMC28688 TaxID=2861283 RepID=UPI001C6322C9|nr:Ig-like domain-containing protein [Massilia sp. PAMC28688]QYF94771.1 Ig-like domain-containing protein [Massilia sp. PAMC28688]
MSSNTFRRAAAHPARLALVTSLTLALAACGGGGGSPGATGNTVNPGTPGTPGTPTTPTTPVPAPSGTLTLTNADGSAMTSIAGTSTGTVRATFKDAAGAPAANVIVKFSASDSLVTFTPESGSALTNADGVAVISIKPATSASAGAVSITATTTVGTQAVTASTNLAVGPGSVVFEPTTTLSVLDESGQPVGTLSGTQSATVRSLIKDSNGNIAPNVIVQYTLSSPLLKFTPQSGSALTNAEGVAQIVIVPASIASAGAVAVTATAVVAGKTTASTTNLSVSAAPLTVSSIAFSPAPTGSLPAESTASLNVGLTAGGRPAAAADGLVLSSLCVNDGAASLTLGTLTNGVQTATYVNKGCGRGTDVITATVGGSSMSTSVGVDAASIGTIQFAGSSPANQSIVLKGSGGQGRQESALLTFRVLDERNAGLAGVNVTFAPSTSTGGLTVQPTSGVTDATGAVTTTVSSGTIPTPVRVLAQATRNGKIITGLSDAVIISTGLPIQKSMSLSVDSYNIKGADEDGVIANVTVRMADQYGNPISDGTAVNFVTEGGAIGTSAQGGCTTSNGGCSVTLKSQNFRPLNGRVTVLAYVQGIEDFIDSNGDGQYSCTNFVSPDGTVPVVYRPLVDICNGGGEPFSDMGDPFLDVGFKGATTGFQYQNRFNTFDGSYDAAEGDLPFPYNRSTYSGTGNGKWGLNYIRATTEITFSDDEPTLTRLNCDGASCRDWTVADGNVNEISGLTGGAPGSCPAPKLLSFRLTDVNNNPLPHKTKVETGELNKVSTSTPSPNVVPSTAAVGGTIHHVLIKPATDCSKGSFAVVLTTTAAGGGDVKYTYNFTAP